MKQSVRRFLLMIAAWPLGIALAIIWLFLPKPWNSPCPPGQACELEPTSFLSMITWLCIAFGPGIIATVRWWRSDDPPAK